jgi:hypothetical protein
VGCRSRLVLNSNQPSRAGLLTQIRILLLLFVAALVFSGATAIPLVWELKILSQLLPLAPDGTNSTYAALARWIHKVHAALADTDSRYPFLAYGTDWLAFGHFAIAIAFIGPLRDPVRNIWVIEFGLIVSMLIIPYAIVLGELRGIPGWWRFIDCCFGLFAIPLLWIARSKTVQLARIESARK